VVDRRPLAPARTRARDHGRRHRRRATGRTATALAALLILGPLAGCGDGDEAERAAAREDLERQFGRRDSVTAAPATPVPDAPGEAGAPASGGEAERADSAGLSEAPGRDEPATPEPGPPPPPSAPPARDTATESAPPPLTGATGFDPDRWLAMADSSYRRLSSLRARFEQRVEVPLLDRTSTGVGIWYQRGRDRFRMDFTDPPDDLFVADGTYLWLYQPSQQPDQVVRTELAAGATPAGTADLLGRILAEARTAYDAVYEGTETVSGVETHVIALTPRGPSEYRLVRVWIAAGDRLVRRFRIEQENEMIRTVTLAALEPGVTLPDSLFRFVPPEGVDVFEG